MSAENKVQPRHTILRRLHRRPKAAGKPIMAWYQAASYTIANAFFRLAFALLAHVEVVGRQNVPRSGRLIISGNHTSWLDPLLVGAYVPRRIVFMSKQENFSFPLAGLLITLYGVFAVKRGEVDRVALARTEQVLQAEGALGMFPEGTRSKSGELRRAKAGTALVALRNNAPILPIAISNAQHGLFTPLLHLHRPRIKVEIGAPFFVEDGDGQSLSKEMLVRLTDELMLPIARMLPPEQRGFYADRLSHP